MPTDQYQIVKKKVRAPGRHGQVLAIPPLSQVESTWTHNLNLLQSHEFEIDGNPIHSIRESAREHLIREATRFTSQYRDVPEFSSDQIILSGHQPKLFHPGVWYKNFALSSLGQSLLATPINIIVDNDLCGLSSVSVPQDSSPTSATTKSIAYDSAGGNLPFETRKIEDQELFRSFGSRLHNVLPPFIKSPLIHSLWKNATSFVDPQHRLGNTIAATRHQLEGQIGLQTLEIPLSTICQSPQFAAFAANLLSQIANFHSIYNDSLQEYRQVHRIRSSAHPVPELAKIDDWHETPFWIWTKEIPLRRAMYFSRRGDQYRISDLQDLEVILERDRFAEQLHALSKRSIHIRPRALITTMYSRLVLSDLFIHGIGGSKYDQLTDAIITRFWKCEPPEFLTMTATMKLPFQIQGITEKDLTNLKRRLRDLEFHPENHISSPGKDAAESIERKRLWIRQYDPSGSNQERHDTITKCNERLQPYVASIASEIKERISVAKKGLARSRVLGSRAYSFCCFDEVLVDELKSMV